MIKEIAELRELREKVRNTIANKVLAIVEFAERNGFNNFLDYFSCPGCDGLWLDDDHIIILGTRDIEIIARSIRTKYENSSFKYKAYVERPTVSDCQKWCEIMLAKIEEAAQIEEEELKKDLKKLEELE